MTALLEIDSVGKSFGRRDVLKSATAWATPGRVSVLMGRNGSGKTTLLRVGLGIHPLDFGVVRYDGITTTRPRLWSLARKGLFFVPHRGLLGKRGTLEEQVRLFRGRFPETDPSGILDELGIGHLMAVTADEMSGGERRRAELALAIARRPRCLVADEPLTEVEPRHRATVSRALRRLAEAGSAVLLTGHEVEDLFSASDEVIWMVAGTTHRLGPPADARRHDHFRREYLGPRA